jgi:L-asparaginase
VPPPYDGGVNSRSSRVALFSLGGTIATASVPGRDAADPFLSGEQLMAAVSGLAETDVDTEVHDLRRVPSSALTIEDIAALAELVQARIAAGADGVVVTQGTDTLEETAFLLDLLYTGDAPVVVTGAMRAPMLAGADGPANLLAAVQVAANPVWRGLGCVVAFADQVHAARWARKVHASSVAAFASPSAGPIGTVAGGRAMLLFRPRKLPPLPAADGPRTVRVGLVTIVLGDDGELLQAAADRFDGLVIAAFGVGNVPARLVPAIAELAERLPVVLASRTGAGSVLVSHRDLPERRTNCSPNAARLALASSTRSRPGCCCTCCWPGTQVATSWRRRSLPTEVADAMVVARPASDAAKCHAVSRATGCISATEQVALDATNSVQMALSRGAVV